MEGGALLCACGISASAHTANNPVIAESALEEPGASDFSAVQMFSTKKQMHSGKRWGGMYGDLRGSEKPYQPQT